jgi:hypothetical protein
MFPRPERRPYHWIVFGRERYPSFVLKDGP